MSTGTWSLREKAQLVSEMLPGHTLDVRGKVIEASLCPLCEKPINLWTPRHSVKMNGRWVKIHQLCPSARYE